MSDYLYTHPYALDIFGLLDVYTWLDRMWTSRQSTAGALICLSSWHPLASETALPGRVLVRAKPARLSEVICGFACLLVCLLAGNTFSSSTSAPSHHQRHFPLLRPASPPRSPPPPPVMYVRGFGSEEISVDYMQIRVKTGAVFSAE